MKHTLSQNLRTLRAARQATQRELADYLHLGQTTVANYENGVRMPDLLTLCRIADFFEVGTDDLLGRTGQTSSAVSPLTDTEQTDLYVSLRSALFTGDQQGATGIIRCLLERGTDSLTIYRDYLARVLGETGDRWAAGTLSVWQEHLSSAMVIDLMGYMRAYLARNRAAGKPRQARRRVLTLLPGGEAHVIGLHMIGHWLEEQGQTVFPLGNHLPAEQLGAAIRALKPNLILISVTMPEYVNAVADLILYIRRAFGAKAPMIVIGGSGWLFESDPARAVDADLFCGTFAEALEAVGRC